MDDNHIFELVVKMQGGDEQAFSELYDEFASRIFRFIRLKVAESDQAEDLLQETFVKAWQGCKKLNDANLNFSAWLYKIAANTVNDHYRKLYRRPQTVELDADLNVASPDVTDKLTQDGFDTEDIHKALDQLLPQYKEIIELRFFQELTVKEIATILNKSSITVRVLQHRAIKKLEQLFKRYGQ